MATGALLSQKRELRPKGPATWPRPPHQQAGGALWAPAGLVPEVRLFPPSHAGQPNWKVISIPNLAPAPSSHSLRLASPGLAWALQPLR